MNRDILLLGASAGGVHALSEVVGSLPPDLPAAVFVVLHISPYGRSAMPAILTRAGALPAVHPQDGDPIAPGRVYVAPPDHHIVLERDRIRVSRGPTENGQRPAVDVLFRTAAEAFGRRVIAVVLTGTLDDGTAGMAVVKRRRGLAVVQDPEEADYPGMPLSAVRNVAVDHVLSLRDIPELLVTLVREPLAGEPELSAPEEERNMKDEVEHGKDRAEGEGVPSDLTCPECGGSLREKQIESVVHFRCRTGHAYSPETLLAKQSEVVDAAIWAAVRALQENAAMARRMEKRLHANGRASGMELRYGRRAEEAERHAEVLRQVLLEDQEETG